MIIGSIIIYLGCQEDSSLAPEVGQGDFEPVSLLKSSSHTHVEFTGISEMDHAQDNGTLKFLPNGKILGTGRISVYYDDMSDPRVKGYSTWYFIHAKIEPDGSGKFNGKADLIVDDNGGKWEMSWHGEMAPDGSIVDYVVGTGTEGAVKGLVAKWTYTRPAGMPGFYNVEGYIIEK